MDTLQDAFNKLYETSKKVCYTDVKSEKQLDDIINLLWEITHQTEKFYIGEDLEDE